MRSVFIHLAWFNHEDGRWIGEWAGALPAPTIVPGLIGEARLLALNAWQQEHQRYITPDGSPFPMHDQLWDRNRWDECPAGGAVCLDVTRFAWPVGDHVWHVWDDHHQALDWPDDYRFIEVDTDLKVIAHQQSHRPVRSAVPGQRVLLISGTSLEPFYDDLWGQFVQRDGTWGFQPTPIPGRNLQPAVEQKLLT